MRLPEIPAFFLPPPPQNPDRLRLAPARRPGSPSAPSPTRRMLGGNRGYVTVVLSHWWSVVNAIQNGWSGDRGGTEPKWFGPL